MTKCHWSWRTDLNPRPADYKSAALPTELRQRVAGLSRLSGKQVKYVLFYIGEKGTNAFAVQAADSQPAASFTFWTLPV